MDDDGPCYFCGKMTNSLAGNPSLWPVFMSHVDALGVAKPHHESCVHDRLPCCPREDAASE